MSFLHIVSLIAAQVSATPTDQAALPPLKMEQQTAVRCSVAFALAAQRQQSGEGADPGWPDVTQSGREFFVRAMAQIMDDTGVTREGLTLYLEAERSALQKPGALEEIMPPCLLILETSGL